MTTMRDADESEGSVPCPELRAASTQATWASRLSDIWDIGVIVLGSGEELDFANTRARTLLGVTSDDALAACCAQLVALVRPQLTRAVPGDAAPVEARVSTPADGADQDLLVQIYALEEDAVGYLLLVQHAERAAAIEASLRHATSNRGLASLYRDTAHDLKGVLNVIAMNLELLSGVALEGRTASADHDLAARCTKVIRRELARLDRAIDVVLDRTMLDRATPERFDLRATCQRLGQLVAARAARQQVEVRLDLGDVPAEISGFVDRVHVALLNLVVNALDAMPEGGSLDLRVRRDADRVIVEVRDSGSGIGEAMGAEIWRLHFTTKPGGTGIGLHVVRTTIEAHGGRITHGPADGGGTCFRLEFPAVATT
jgi:signal transduction histidine kinase